MSNLRISQYEIKSFGSKIRNQAIANYFVSVQTLVQSGDRRQALIGSILKLPRARKQTMSGFLYASLVALAGCATSAEIESLRAEVAKANAAAARAEARADMAQRQLAELEEASEPPEVVSRPLASPTTAPPDASGYKWGKLRKE